MTNDELWIDPIGCKVYFSKPKELCPDESFRVIKEQKVSGEISKSLEYHKNQRDVNRDLNNRIAYHHEIIIDFIENELKERLGLE
jgi:hypothetical protein